MDPGAEPKFSDLTKAQRTEVLNRYIDWTGFAPTQADQLIENIASGKGRQNWFDGVPPGWRGFGERSIQEWLAFDRLPEEDQLREAARMMKRSRTLEGDAVRVYAKWEEMNEQQRREVVDYQLGGSEASGMSYRKREEIIKEELGYPPPKEREPQIRVLPGKDNQLDYRDDRSFDIHDATGKIGYLTGYLGGPWSDADSPTEFRATHVEITAPDRKLSPGEWKDVLQGLRENLPEAAELVGWGKYGEGGGLSAAEEKLFRLPERSAQSQSSEKLHSKPDLDSRLMAEWTHDYGLRRMEDRGVKYEDQVERGDGGRVTKKPFQVWHKNVGPTWTEEDFPVKLPYEFPRDYTHVANVQAESLLQAVWRTQNERHGHIDSYKIPGGWPSFKCSEALVENPRSTAIDDILVDPEGTQYRLKPYSEFERVDVVYDLAHEKPAAGPRLPSPSEVAARNKQPHRPEPGHGQEHGHGR